MIGWLVKDFFGASPMLALPKIALIIFLIVFVAVTIRTLLMKKNEVSAQAHLALEDGNLVPVQGDSGTSRRGGRSIVVGEKHHG
jgi:L-asparagine transporter-like permease